MRSKRTWAMLFLALMIMGLIEGGLRTGFAAAAHPGYYRPLEFADMDLEDPASPWCWQRSRESEHFICFWERGFGEDPAAAPAPYAVDTADLLDKAERFWHTNVDQARMADPAASQLSRYKMQIYLVYTLDWVAAGAGYDNVIGALWISPPACRPAGRVVAHEIGHCFQYQVYCDQLLSGAADDGRHGFRYGYTGSNGGNGLWEQCAQWVSFLDDPEGRIAEMGMWPRLCNLAFEHEWTRYESYWLQQYWTLLHGPAALGRIWRESAWPEDALAAYTRLFLQGDIEKRNDMLFSYAAAMAAGELLPDRAAWDLSLFAPALYRTDDGWLQIGYAGCPGVGGFNIIPLEGSARIQFQGLPAGAPLCSDDPGLYRVTGPDGEPAIGGQLKNYNRSDVPLGWRYGVITMENAGCILHEIHRDAQGDILFQMPEGCEGAYLLVVGTPGEATVNPWDDDERTDVQCPYRIRLDALSALDE